MEYNLTTTCDAPPDQVWPLFVDVERWPEMTKSVREARRVDSGPLRVGSEAVIKQPRLPQARWRVTELDPGHSFTWENKSGGVTGVGSHVVVTDGPGSKITITLRTHGPLAGVIDLLMGRLARRHVDLELEGFRSAADTAAPPAPPTPPAG